MTPVDPVPVATLRLPAGVSAEIDAIGMPGARLMTEGPNGTIFAGSRDRPA